MDLIWGYDASSLGRAVAEEWIAANDCSIVASITISANSLVITGHPSGRRPGISITMNRQWDLGADLAEAVRSLQQQLNEAS